MSAINDYYDIGQAKRLVLKGQGMCPEFKELPGMRHARIMVVLISAARSSYTHACIGPNHVSPRPRAHGLDIIRDKTQKRERDTNVIGLGL